MRLAVISDLHIGPSPNTDAFGHDADQFCSFLDRLEASHDRIILLGDIYQCDHGPIPGRESEIRQLKSAQQRSQWLTDRIADSGYVLLSGNHDTVTTEVLGAQKLLVLEDNGVRVLLTHGDQFDPALQNIPMLSATATWFVGRLRSAGLRGVSQWLEGRDVSIKADRFQIAEGPYAEGAKQLMREHRTDFVVFGHTHVPWKQNINAGFLLNSGTCSLGQRMFVSIDTRTRTGSWTRGDRDQPTNTS